MPAVPQRPDAARAARPVTAGAPTAVPVAETPPVVPRRAKMPQVAAGLQPTIRLLAPTRPALAPATLPAAAPQVEVLSRSAANPALAVPGDAADPAPDAVADARPEGDAAPPKPPVRRGGTADLAQADPAPPLLKKAAPLAPAPGLRTAGAPVTDRAGAVRDDAPPADAEPADGLPPRAAFARPFGNPAQKPLLAVVLLDTGVPDIDRAALAALPFPVTFVLDPTRTESALAAGIYRAGGQEVAMLATGIPQGATAADVEVTFAAHARALPESVAVVVPESGGFQDNRPVATLVVPVIAGQGRGLLSWDRGLNAADQVARREGAHAATIFRRIDGKDEDAARIRQYLDRAAFKAAQEGRVVVAGETRPQTVQALLEWAVEGRAATVALAPLTAVLQAQ